MDIDNNIHIIVAMTKNRLIGVNDKLPWNLAEDLNIFREKTVGNCVIMGRKTYESIGRPLPDRTNIVISSSLSPVEGVEICRSFTEGVARAKSMGLKIFCIGGVEIYQQALLQAGQLHISWVADNVTGDTYFPEFDLSQWQMTASRQHDGFTHITYQREKGLK